MLIREQSGVVPIIDGKTVVLVRSSSDRAWVFPKGGVEKDLTKRKSAAKEAMEEAGVEGKVVERLGTYTYRKGGKLQVVAMFRMDVTRVHSAYLENDNRVRKIVTVDKAMNMVTGVHQQMLKRAVQHGKVR